MDLQLAMHALTGPASVRQQSLQVQHHMTAAGAAGGLSLMVKPELALHGNQLARKRAAFVRKRWDNRPAEGGLQTGDYQLF